VEAIRKTPEIWHLLTEGVVCLEMQAEDREAVFSELVDALLDKGVVPPGLPVLDEVLRREAVLSTGVGNGVALPHARLSGFNSQVLAFGRPAEPVDVGAVDSNPADLFFLLIADRNDPGTIVRILGRLARLCDDETVRNKLREVTDSSEVIELFHGYEEEGAAGSGP
jgi:PTS system fructose-specific IIC component